MYVKSKILMSVVLAYALTFAGCTTVTHGPDGQVQVQEPDYMVIQMLSTASIAAWAAAQKEGITSDDAQALVSIIDSVVSYHEDGSPIESGAWSVEIAKQVPQRWQALAVVFVQLTEYQLKKYGVESQIPTPDSVGGKVMSAIVLGAKLGLAPYLKTGTIWEDRTVQTQTA